MNKSKLSYKCIHTGLLSRDISKLNLVICSKMEKTGRHYTKLNKPDTEKQVLWYNSCMWKLKKLELNAE